MQCLSNNTDHHSLAKDVKPELGTGRWIGSGWGGVCGVPSTQTDEKNQTKRQQHQVAQKLLACVEPDPTATKEPAQCCPQQAHWCPPQHYAYCMRPASDAKSWQCCCSSAAPGSLSTVPAEAAGRRMPEGCDGYAEPSKTRLHATAHATDASHSTRAKRIRLMGPETNTQQRTQKTTSTGGGLAMASHACNCSTTSSRWCLRWTLYRRDCTLLGITPIRSSKWESAQPPASGIRLQGACRYWLPDTEADMPDPCRRPCTQL